VEGSRAAALRTGLLFAGLEEADLAEIGRLAVPVEFPAGGHIFREHDEARGFYLVETGTVKVYKLSSGGREQVLHHVGRGEAFGEVALFAGRTYPASALALTPARLLFFPKSAFLSAIAAKPALALNMIGTLAMRLRSFAALVEALTLKDASSRLAAYLLELAERKSTSYQGKSYLDLEMKKGELASRLGTVSETLSRAFRKLKEEGLIEVEGSRVIILDMEGLKRISGAPQKG